MSIMQLQRTLFIPDLQDRHAVATESVRRKENYFLHFFIGLWIVDDTADF